MNRIFAIAMAGVLAGPALAEGDAEKGEKAFNKCKACHAVVTDAGDTIIKGGKTGPNLYGVIGQAAGSVEGYKYGDSLAAAGANGLVWDEVSFAEYVADPKGFLKTYLDDTSAKSKMSFKLKKGAEDIYAFLVSASAE